MEVERLSASAASSCAASRDLVLLKRATKLSGKRCPKRDSLVCEACLLPPPWWAGAGAAGGWAGGGPGGAPTLAGMRREGRVDGRRHLDVPRVEHDECGGHVRVALGP